jgi:hypothetical protein
VVLAIRVLLPGPPDKGFNGGTILAPAPDVRNRLAAAAMGYRTTSRIPVKSKVTT